MTARTLAVAALAALALGGCGDPKPVPARAAAAPSSALAQGAPAAEAKPAAPQEPAWTYSSAGKRDPFKSYLSEIAETQAVATKCSTPLGRFELEQLRLVAVVTGLEDPVAMVEAPNGIGYDLRRGACVGRNGGTVAAVRTGEVVITEWVTKADGARDKTQTFLRLPKEAALQIEE